MNARRIVEAIGGTLLVWSTAAQLEQATLGTAYVPIIFAVSVVMAGFGEYVRYLIRTGYRPVLS